jgi:hypothetical protein
VDSLKAMLHGAIFLATCNAILLLRDVKLPNTSLHYNPLMFSTELYYITGGGAPISLQSSK